MNRQLRANHLTAEQRGHCLVCGGVNGVCTCTAPVKAAIAKRPFTDHRKEGQDSKWYRCFRCRGLVGAPASEDSVICACGYDIRVPLQPAPTDEPVITELPRRALRKPSLTRARA